MATIPATSLAELGARGLVVSEPFVPNHVAFPDGIVVGKPSCTAGHNVPGFRACWGLGDVYLDAPALYLHGMDGRWFVTLSEWVPGPGPSDFVREFGSVSEAVADILDFYFGDPARMNSARAAHR